jgi:phosphatidylglycerol lysyltransferase
VRLYKTEYCATLIHLIARKDVTPFLNSFDQAMVLGVKALGKHRLSLSLLAILIAAEWISTIVAVWFCFDALGSPISVGILITGFAVGISAGNLSMIPGGFGVQEASMAGVYALLGISFEKAVLVSIMFRIIYDFVPFLVSLFLYRSLLRPLLHTDE